MKLLICSVTVLIAGLGCLAKIEIHPLSDEFINSINQAQNSWKAGRNFDVQTPMSYINTLMGLKDIKYDEPIPTKEFHAAKLQEIPEAFDARERWPECPSLNHITDQSECGSCWAVAAAAVMTDRLCIKSHGKLNTSVSAANLMECCTFCGDGCNGGSGIGPWLYWSRHGIVSGGDYGSNDVVHEEEYQVLGNDSAVSCNMQCTLKNAPQCKTERIFPNNSACVTTSATACKDCVRMLPNCYSFE